MLGFGKRDLRLTVRYANLYTKIPSVNAALVVRHTYILHIYSLTFLLFACIFSSLATASHQISAKLHARFISKNVRLSKFSVSNLVVDGGSVPRRAVSETRLYCVSRVANRLPSSVTSHFLSNSVKEALLDAFPSELSGQAIDSMVLPAKAEHGDYQCNVALSLAKTLKLKPRSIAEEILIRLEGSLDGVCTMDISGPGFINMKLTHSYVESRLQKMLADESKRLGIARATKPQKIVVDFSSPNIAKEMHVVRTSLQ